MPATVEESTPPAAQAVIKLNDLQSLSHTSLLDQAVALGLKLRPESTKRHLVLDHAKHHIAQGTAVEAVGLLEINGDHGVLRWPAFGLRPGPDDVYVPQQMIRQHKLEAGLMLRCTLRLPKERERGLVIDTLLFIEDIPLAEWQPPTPFDKLTPLFPNRRVFLESNAHPSISARAVDIVAPLGMGQRGLIVAPPRAGKTMMLKDIARAIHDNHPKAVLILLLVDERPEEVTDLRRSLDCEIYSSTFDEPVTRHVQVCEAVSERAKRMVELRKDVIVLVDSLTRMARGYNNLQPNKGRTMSGGVDTKALTKPRKFFGSARNTEEGGSLTILATALVETKSRMDDLIFEEFKGTGNMEVHLDRSIAEQRIFPAIHIIKSGTRREELLYHPDEYEKVVVLRRQLSELPAAEAMEVLAANLRHTRFNAELLLGGLKGA
ncbi:transcription termination factor Rho [Spartobacteria bacterium LR76]|nr:transcription termination factor Rho [Spartobacteria bacterium LR76]